jgi:GT2 family glycosyltransferase
VSFAAQPHIAIIILNWNQRQVTLDCLASLREQHYSNLSIILVDNGSSDGSVAAVHSMYPEVTVLQNSENLGFAEGNNVGIRYALQSDAQYIMLMNNDTTVDPEMLDDLVAVIGADTTVGIVGPKMLYFDHPDLIWCAGNKINWRNGKTIRLQSEQKDKGADGDSREVDFITACAIILRRQVIEQIGLLDPRFFIYYEETDWCIRARRVGWHILYVPRARLYHKVSAAMGITSPATDYYMNRNVMLFLAKNLRGWSRMQALALAILDNLRIIIVFTLKSHSGQRLLRRNARVLALRDAMQGRWGKMGQDVVAVCSLSK